MHGQPSVNFFVIISNYIPKYFSGDLPSAKHRCSNLHQQNTSVPNNMKFVWPQQAQLGNVYKSTKDIYTLAHKVTLSDDSSDSHRNSLEYSPK
jgi:hypothetical protein